MKNFLKEKLKNKFIIFVLVIITIILWIQGYKAALLLWVDRNSYVELIKWEWTINDKELILKNKNSLDKNKVKLNIWDIIITKWIDSISVIKWWDWSITRMWWNTKIIIKNLDIEKDLSKIQIQFDLLSWKSHTNVISYLGEKSYFKQNFEDTEATVRGTTFDVDLTKKFVYVQNHEVILKKWNKETIVKEGSAFDFSIFSFIEIKKFLDSIRDKAWIDLNKSYDKIHIEELKKEISETFSRKNINNLIEEAVWDSADDLIKLDRQIKEFSKEKKEKIYNSLLEQYQKLNFITAEDWDLFKIKNDIKKLLISSAKEEEKENLIKYSIYDFQDALNSKNLDGIKNSLNLLWENIDIVKKLDFELNMDFFKDFKIIPNSMKNFFKENWKLLENVLWDKISNFDFPDFDLDEIKNKAEFIKDKINNSDSLNNVKEGALNKLNEIWNLFNK